MAASLSRRRRNSPADRSACPTLSGARSAIGVLRFVWAYFLRPRRNLRWYGQWAVVTGATDGIGKEYAAQLACQGACCPLDARVAQLAACSSSELQALADALCDNFITEVAG